MFKFDFKNGTIVEYIEWRKLTESQNDPATIGAIVAAKMTKAFGGPPHGTFTGEWLERVLGPDWTKYIKSNILQQDRGGWSLNPWFIR